MIVLMPDCKVPHFLEGKFHTCLLPATLPASDANALPGTYRYSNNICERMNEKGTFWMWNSPVGRCSDFPQVIPFVSDTPSLQSLAKASSETFRACKTLRGS